MLAAVRAVPPPLERDGRRPLLSRPLTRCAQGKMPGSQEEMQAEEGRKRCAPRI